MPDIVTLCSVCNRVSSNACKLCGRHLCSKHYDSKTGLCPTCSHNPEAQGQGSKKWVK